MELETNNAKIQEDVLAQIAKFTSENPEIEEALKVMNMSVPEYLLALDALRGSQTVSLSAFVSVPIEVKA